MSKPILVVSKITPDKRKPKLAQHTLQLAQRMFEPVVQMSKMYCRGHKSEQQAHQLNLHLRQLNGC